MGGWHEIQANVGRERRKGNMRAFTLTFKMEPTSSFEILMTQCQNSEDDNLKCRCYEHVNTYTTLMDCLTFYQWWGLNSATAHEGHLY